MKIYVELERTQNFRMIDRLVFFVWPSKYLGRRGKNFPAYNLGPYGKISILHLIFHVF